MDVDFDSSNKLAKDNKGKKEKIAFDKKDK